MTSKRLAIIGASYLQNPLIEKAKELGYETHVFAWAADDVGEKTADVFHPVSITEFDEIADICKDLDVVGICTIATDLGNKTASYVANKLGLPSNPFDVVERSTDKALMRQCFYEHGDPSPRSTVLKKGGSLEIEGFKFPLIVKPSDRSGSRGIKKINIPDELEDAIENALAESFNKTCVIEEFVDGEEFSVEFISFEGTHYFLALTKKFTTGAPGFIETGHIEPADVSDETLSKIKITVSHALDSLGVITGASHSEVKVDDEGNVSIIEIGSRMGGDLIGSHLVELSTGYDFIKGVIDCATGNEPDIDSITRINPHDPSSYALVRFIFSNEDIQALKQAKNDDLCKVVYEDVDDIDTIDASNVKDSSSRYGCFLITSDTQEALEKYYPRV